MESFDEYEAFMRWTQSSLRFRQACAGWQLKQDLLSKEGSASAKRKKPASDDRVWNDDAVTFICEWAKKHPGLEKDWDGCFGLGKKKRILACKNSKCCSTAFSEVKKSSHPQHWVYQSVFGGE